MCNKLFIVATTLFFPLTAILHLGQVNFSTVTDASGDSSVVRGADRGPLEKAAGLLGVPLDQLETALVRKKSLVIRGEINVIFSTL